MNIKESVLDVLMYLYENYVEQEFADSANHDTLRVELMGCLLYTSPSPRDRSLSRMPSSA